jgi:uncharacterized membrane protein
MLGLISSSLAIFLAYLTLKFINPILGMLGNLLGHDIAKSLFYGSCTKSSMHIYLALSLMVITPILCAISAYFATQSFKKKSASEFLKDSR